MFSMCHQFCTESGTFRADFNKPTSEIPETFCTLNFSELDALMANPSSDPIFAAHGGKFDMLASFSSLEHDGLGRYGDPMDPYGDIKRLQKLQHYLNPGGLFLLAVPTGIKELHRTHTFISFC